MKHLPLFFDIQQQPCLVVGAGGVAARKIERLVKANASVIVVAEDMGEAVAQMHQQGVIRCQLKAFEANDMNGMRLVIAATNNAALNANIAALAQEKNILVNVIDNPKLGNLLMPSIIDRGLVQIAISTGGASPVLARLLKSKLEATIPASYGGLAELFEKYRQRVKQAFSSINLRRRFWESILESPVAEFVYSGRIKDADVLLSQLIESEGNNSEYKGEVYLVGAGPGDPDLLTFKALRLMQKCDVVIYDRLVSDPILALVRADAEKIYAGKENTNHSIPQENINQLLVRLAKQGKRVLRLKGGDPFIFGRGGEEIAEIINENIDFQVVPGITAASGCATYAGIPLTHRDYSQACIFVTGHRKKDGDDLNWDMLSHANQTVVFYMGLDNIERICRELKNHGRAESTPVALIEKGTMQVQRVLVGNLNTLPEIVKNNNVHAPTLIIVGEVVNLHSQLNWFQSNQEDQQRGIMNEPA